MIALLVLLGCGSGGQATRSAPVPPTVELNTEDDQAPEFTDLEGLFVKGPVQLPAPLTDVRFGAPIALVRVANKGVADPDRPVMDATVAEARVIGGTPRGYPDVRHSFIVEDDRLAAIDVSLPAKAAMPVLTDMWGEPELTGVDDQGRPTAAWSGPTVRATLLEVEERGIVTFVPVGGN